MNPLNLLPQIFCLGLVILFLVACGASSVSISPTATPTSDTSSPTFTPEAPTATPTPFETPTPTLTPLPTDTVTPDPTATPTSTATSAPAPTATEDQVPKDIGEVPRVWPEDLMERLDNSEAILIADSRAKNAYDFRHIAGAISVPVDEVESRLDEFPLDQEIVLYCT